MTVLRRRSFLCFAALFLCLYARYATLSGIYDDGTEILIPVTVDADERSGFPYVVSLRYDNIVPARDVLSLSGTAVVDRSENGAVSFVRNYRAGEPLRPQELLLRYNVATDGRSLMAKVDFSAAFFPFYTAERRRAFMQTIRKTPARYAILRAGAGGRALLRGFADKDGVPLPLF